MKKLTKPQIRKIFMGEKREQPIYGDNNFITNSAIACQNVWCFSIPAWGKSFGDFFKNYKFYKKGCKELSFSHVCEKEIQCELINLAVFKNNDTEKHYNLDFIKTLYQCKYQNIKSIPDDLNGEKMYVEEFTLKSMFCDNLIMPVKI